MCAPAALLTTLAALAALAALSAPVALAADLHPDIAEDARLDVPGLVRKYGYPLEEHAVQTEDGYVLTAHRIPHARGAPVPVPGARTPVPVPGARTPVLVMHGLMCSSADFLVLGPGAALGYLLADAGYDVWLANARGNAYSRRHRALDPDDAGQDFWRFSWDEIGERDLPALVEHVSAVTGRRRMHFVGYSQGTTAFLVLAALRPLYNARFLSFQALAPAAFVEYGDDSLKDTLVQFENVLHALAFRLGFAEVMRHSNVTTELALRHCRDGARLQPLCARLVLGSDNDYFNKTLLPVFLGHNPAGAAVRQIIHYAQVQRFRRFARFDFGARENLARYGRARPPEYDVTHVRVPVHLHYAMSDRNSLHQNVLVLARRLGAVAELHRVPRHSFNHYDFIWGSDARAQLYDTVVAAMRAHDAPQ